MASFSKYIFNFRKQNIYILSYKNYLISTKYDSDTRELFLILNDK